MRKSFYLTLLTVAVAAVFHAHIAVAGPKGGVVAYTITPAAGDQANSTKIWLPYPLSNDDQTIHDVNVSGNHVLSAVYRDPRSEAVFLFADWAGAQGQPTLTLSFRVNPTFKKGAPLKASNEPIPAEVKRAYLGESEWIPVGAFKEQAAKIIKGKKTILDKARAVYDWTVDNTFRDPNVKGCGLGIPGRTMSECKGGGKCADISAVFVTMARAAGIPARDVYGLRMAEPKSGEITGDFHCWAEFYLPGTGWVMVDPADVRKMMLVHKLDPKDPEAKKWREFFWNGDDLFRIVLNKNSRGVVLTPPQKGAPINYFMYPFGQVKGETLNYFDPKAFSYKVDLKVDE